jgi:hypothetical protein
MSSSRIAVPAIALMALTALAACDGGVPSEPEVASDASSAAARPGVAPLCHFDSEAGAYVLLDVVGQAVAAHRGHGDAAPLEPIPGRDHYGFNLVCEPYFISYGELEQLTPVAASYETFLFHGTTGGEVTGNVVPVDINLTGDRFNTSACDAADFAGIDFSGPNDIALVQRGSCNFGDKVLNATLAGAEAVVIFNQGDTPGREGPLAGATATLLTNGATVVPTIPIVSASFAAGQALAQPGSTARVLAVPTD